MTIDFTLEQVLNGGFHANIGIVVDGGPKVILFVCVDDLRASQSAADKKAAALTILATKLQDAVSKPAAAAMFPFTVTL